MFPGLSIPPRAHLISHLHSETHGLCAAAELTGFSVADTGGWHVAGEGTSFFLGADAPRGSSLLDRCVLVTATLDGVRNRAKGWVHEALKNCQEDSNLWEFEEGQCLAVSQLSGPAAGCKGRKQESRFWSLLEWGLQDR